MMNRKSAMLADTHPLGPTCGELAARAVGVEAGTLDAETVWAWLMGSAEAGAYCPLAWREREGGMGRRMVIPKGGE